MPDFDIHILATVDGSWDKFIDDWKSQCAQVGEVYDDYASDSLPLLGEVVTGTTPSLGGQSTSKVAALWDKESERYYACWLLNHAMIPGVDGFTLRVRHILVSPLLDYGQAPMAFYPDVIVGIIAGVVHLSSTQMAANHIRFHLRSPEDVTFFRALGTDLHGSGVFASVQTHGAWLYITKAGAAPAAAGEGAQDV